MAQSPTSPPYSPVSSNSQPIHNPTSPPQYYPITPPKLIKETYPSTVTEEEAQFVAEGIVNDKENQKNFSQGIEFTTTVAILDQTTKLTLKIKNVEREILVLIGFYAFPIFKILEVPLSDLIPLQSPRSPTITFGLSIPNSITTFAFRLVTNPHLKGMIENEVWKNFEIFKQTNQPNWQECRGFGYITGMDHKPKEDFLHVDGIMVEHGEEFMDTMEWMINCIEFNHGNWECPTSDLCMAIGYLQGKQNSRYKPTSMKKNFD